MENQALEDKFHLPNSVIPKGLAYQWVTVSVCGNESFDLTGRYLKSGWKFVPAKRHQKLFPKQKGKIIVDGLALMQHKRTYVKKRRDEELALAKSMVVEPTSSNVRRIVATVHPHPAGNNGKPVSYGFPAIRWGFRGLLDIFGILWDIRKLGLSYRQIITANDGTLVYNHGPNAGNPIGSREMSRRVKLMGCREKLEFASTIRSLAKKLHLRGK